MIVGLPRDKFQQDEHNVGPLKRNHVCTLPRTHAYLVEQILLRNKVFLEHVLVEVVGRADAPLHTAAGHLNTQTRRGSKAGERWLSDSLTPTAVLVMFNARTWG